ncbi:MAG TPA: VOC family protein [Luteimicrobium sp.]|nr:VOC family protein [Luteimicrobium sp.]
MDVRLVALRLDASDPAVPAAFWAGLLGRAAVVEPGSVLLPGDATQVGLRFVRSAAPKVAQNPVHLHLTSATLADQQATVDRALALGGRHVDVGQRPEETHVVLGDPGGNELCVIEPGNTYLAGTGFLGEVTCRGTRDVGLFWSAALGWPLVWDRDEETAVQSPGGGTKLSWGGEPVDPDAPPQRQRLELATTDDLAGVVDRLVALGATRVDGAAGSVTLADPDGQELLLHRG